jgi:hypothetical protein
MTRRFLLRLCFVTVLAPALPGCKPPPAIQPAAAPQPGAASTPAAGASAPAAPAPSNESQEETIDGLPKKVVENVEQVIKLTAEYNARAEKITDRQAYLDQSGSLAELENELSDYVQYMESVESTLTPAQQATLDSKYFSRAKPLIDAKRMHKMRMLALVQ